MGRDRTIKELDRVGANYLIHEYVACGGFGEVYRAEHILLQRMVALKARKDDDIVQPPYPYSSALMEARTLAGLKHPHLPVVYDVFRFFDRIWIAMEWIEGVTLRNYGYQFDAKKLPLKEALAVGIQLCDVLEFLGSRPVPIVFRDVTPNNVIISPQGHVYLIDFGIARTFKPGQSRDTICLGSPQFRAPEQERGAETQTTPLTDIYGLASSLYYLLSQGRSVPKQDEHPVIELPTAPEMACLLNAMLSKDARSRPQSFREVRCEFVRLADGLEDDPTWSIGAQSPAQISKVAIDACSF